MDWVETAVMRNPDLRGVMLMFFSSAAAAGHCQHPFLYLQSPLPSSSAEEPACASVDRSGACENFSVDDLLDLVGGKEQNGGEDDLLRAAEAEDEEEEEEEEEKEGKDSSMGFSASSFSDLSFQALPPSSDPIVHAGDLADLEWVSPFVDDSYSEFPSVVAPALLQNHHVPTPPPVDVAAKAEAPKP